MDTQLNITSHIGVTTNWGCNYIWLLYPNMQYSYESYVGVVGGWGRPQLGRSLPAGVGYLPIFVS